MKKNLRESLDSLLTAAIVSIAIAGCGGGHSDHQATVVPGACEFVAGGDSSVTVTIDSGCSNCSVSDKEKAADGDLSTSADLTANYSPGECNLVSCQPNSGIAIRATAQSGVVFPAGQHAGAWLTLPAGSWTLIPKTYLNGSLQDSGAEVSQGSNQQGQYVTAVEATKPFDAVEVFVSNDQSGGDPTALVQEICADIK